MLYRVRIDLGFQKLTDAEELITLLKSKLLLALNMGIEKANLVLEECHHDESPPASCKILKRIEK